MAKDKAPETTNWALTDVAFARLLEWLDPTQEHAGQRYERLRQKLRLFFEHRGCLPADDLTDQTLDRVAKKLAAGEEIIIADPASYCYGVAHNILKEYWRDPAHEAISLDSQPDKGNPPAYATVHPSAAGELQETELNLDHLDVCLQRLSPKDRTLILKYYEGDHRGRINNRHDLAAELGLTPGNLRIRALRIREQLHDWMRRCKAGGDGK
ncbi:MAG: RNA polymerase sigma factor [Blastocatellia bacterium]